MWMTKTLVSIRKWKKAKVLVLCNCYTTVDYTDLIFISLLPSYNSLRRHPFASFLFSFGSIVGFISDFQAWRD